MVDNENTYQDSIRLRSEAVQEVLGLVPSWMIRWGNALIFLLIVGVFSMSYLIKYPDALNTEMEITTTYPPYNSYSEFDGEFEKILVVESTKVTKGELLAVLKDKEGKQYALTSPTNGMVYFSDFWKERMLVKKGTLIFTIVPENHGPFIGKIAITPTQLEEVFIGQQVEVSLSEKLFSIGGTTIKGSIKGITKAVNEKNMFHLEVELDNKDMLEFGQEVGVLKLGMKAKAKIITEDLRLLQRFFYRVKDIFQ